MKSNLQVKVYSTLTDLMLFYSGPKQNILELSTKTNNNNNKQLSLYES